MGNDEIAAKAKDMFDDIMTIDSHFENAGYKGDAVILGIKELAEFIRFYQPAEPFKPIMSQDEDEWKLTDGISIGYGNTPQAAKAAYDEDKAFKAGLYKVAKIPEIEVVCVPTLNQQRILEIANTHSNFLYEGNHVFSDRRLKDFCEDVVKEYRTELTQPKADVEGLKHEMTKHLIDRLDVHAKIEADHIRQTIDHLAAQGVIGVPDKSERQILCEALDRIGWNEIYAFRDELRKGQSIYEDAGGYFKRAIARLFGIVPRDEVVSYRQAAQKLIDELQAAPKKED